MILFLYATIFVFGLLIGSFLNVCIYRIPRDLSVVAPRSFCPECGKQLTWIQNLPLLSFVLLKGKCRHCSQRISFRYPLVELLTAVQFVLIASRYGLNLAAMKWMVFGALLIVLFWTDLEERILPDELTIGGSIVGLLLAAFVQVPGTLGELLFPDAGSRLQSLFNAATGALVLALPIWLVGSLYGRLRKREALGLGDIKLLVMIGVFLGPAGGLSALTIGAVGGALTGIALVVWAKKDAASYELPFGSFLCLGAIIIPILSAPATGPLAVR